MSKKKHDVLEAERQNFVSGCKECGISATVASGIFDSMTSFASYAFNKSHAAAYALIAYQTAWLKCHYPCEFFAAQLSAYLENATKVAEYTAEANRLGINILPPHVNEGAATFTANNGVIRFGMLAIKGLGLGVIDEILRERINAGEFTSFYNFCRRMFEKKGFNKRSVEALINAGALDGLGEHRRQMLLALPDIADMLTSGNGGQISGQVSFGELLPELNNKDDYILPKAKPFSRGELLRLEKDVLGLYISDHPLKEYADRAKLLKCAPIAQLTQNDEDFSASAGRDGETVRVLAVLTRVRNRLTRKSESMAILTAEDMSGAFEVLVFPRVLENYRHLLLEGDILVLQGRLSVREDEDAKLLLDTCIHIEEIGEDGKLPDGFGMRGESRFANTSKQNDNKMGLPTNAKRLCLRFSGMDCLERKQAEKLLAIFSGEDAGKVPVLFYFTNEKKYDKKPPAALNEPLLRELIRLLGEDNVVVQ